MSQKLKYEQRVAHLKAGYDNSQSVVRFIDTKIALLLAGVFTVLGASITFTVSVLELLKNYSDKIESWNGVWSWLPVALLLFGIITIALMIWTLIRCHNTLTPRSPEKSVPSAIFPYIDVKNPEDSGRIRVRLFKDGNANEDNVLDDWVHQLERMGEINQDKIVYCKKATDLALKFFISATIYNFLIILISYP